jgi:hypothetical protein
LVAGPAKLEILCLAWPAIIFCLVPATLESQQTKPSSSGLGNTKHTKHWSFGYLIHV